MEVNTIKLPNGFGTAYKLSGNRRKPYIARKTTEWTPEGKQVFATIGYYATKEEAFSALVAFNDDPFDLLQIKRTFAEIYDEWSAANAETLLDNKSTRRNYEAAYKHCTALYNKPIKEIRPAQLQRALDDCPAGHSSAVRMRILFNQLYKFCLEREILKKNHAEHLRITHKQEHNERQAFTSEELQILWDNVNQNAYVSIVLMLIYSGVRISELLDLKKEDVNLAEQYFTVRESKTEAGRNRIVPIADKVLPFWQAFMLQSQCTYAVCTVDGQKLTDCNFRKRYWHPLMQQLNMQHTPHECRHTFISQMVMRNANQTIVKKIVGHKSIMNLTERVYAHIEIRDLINEVNRI